MSNTVAVSNPFGSPPAPTTSTAVAKSDSERAIQEVQASLVIAKRFPRNPIEAMDRILNACTREKLAEGALYSYPRGGQQVTGPSIRLAEALAQNWGNIQFGIRELSSDNGVSEVEAFAWDVETNTRQVKVFQVPHVRHTRQGKKPLTDPRDIYEMIANQGARRMRACILGVIPADVIEEAVKQCELTQQSNVDVTPEAISKIVDYFAGYGVSQQMIEKRLQRRLEAMNPPQMLDLRRIAKSMQDGMSRPADWFDVNDPESIPEGAPVSDLNETLKEKPKAKAPAKKPAKEEPEAPAVSYASLCEAINAASDPEALSGLLESIEDFLSADDNEKFRDEIQGVYKHRMTALES